MFKSELHVARDMSKRHCWVLLAPLVWDDGEQVHTVPVGFEFDFASIPQAAQVKLPKNGMFYDRASCLHDWFYATHLVDRKTADKLFYTAMLVDGTPKFRAWVMYQAVRFGGSAPWKAVSAETISFNRNLATRNDAG
jgi:hypothetical protein